MFPVAQNQIGYYEYSTHKTRDAAELALDDYFGLGIICEGEKPYIESRRRPARGELPARVVWCVMFPGY